MKTITSRDNPLLKTVRLVQHQSKRISPDLVLAEGMRTVEEAVHSEYPIEAALYSDSFGGTPMERELLALLARRVEHVCQTRKALYASVSSVNSPQGILALVRVPVAGLTSFALPENLLLVCAWGIQDPGNLGTLIRTARAAGASLLCTSPGTVSARNPKAVRSSAGAFFKLPIAEGIHPLDLLAFCEARQIKPWITSPHTGTEYCHADFRAASALILGNEAQGISSGHFAVLPRLRILMAAGTESLNVSAAGAVLMMEAFRQRSQQ